MMSHCRTPMAPRRLSVVDARPLPMLTIAALVIVSVASYISTANSYEELPLAYTDSIRFLLFGNTLDPAFAEGSARHLLGGAANISIACRRRILSFLEPPMLEPSELLATVIADFSSIALAMGSRAWRKDLPTYVAVAEPGMPISLEEELEVAGSFLNETWGVWPYKSLFPESASASVSNLPAFHNDDGQRRIITSGSVDGAASSGADGPRMHLQQQRRLQWFGLSSSPAHHQAAGVRGVDYINKEQAAALAILAAHKATNPAMVSSQSTASTSSTSSSTSQGYKWMLVGLPETLFYADNIRRLLLAFDHQLPYAISDSFIYGNSAPSHTFPRCLPCHYQVEDVLMAMYNGVEGAFPSGPPEFGCPCTQRAACTGHRHNGWDPHLQSAPAAQGLGPRQHHECTADSNKPGCSVLRDCRLGLSSQAGAPMLPYAADLGSGFILSRGLLERIASNASSERAFMDCIGRLAPLCRGLGCSFTQCLAQQLDVAFTDPGPSLLHRSREWMLFNNIKLHECLAQALKHLVEDNAHEHCRWLMRNALSLRIPQPAAPAAEGSSHGSRRQRRRQLGQGQQEWGDAVHTATAMHRGALAWLASEDYASLS